VNSHEPAGDSLPITPARVARALVDVLGGYEAGCGLWLSSLGKLEATITECRDGRDRFCSWPKGELRRLTTHLQDALDLAATAAELQLAVNEDPADVAPADLSATIADVLQDRALDLARRRAAL